MAATSGTSGQSGYSGLEGYSGFSGSSGESGVSGFSGIGPFSGHSGASGTVGAVGTTGFSGTSGFQGCSGPSGTSGKSGTSGASGFSGDSGTSGFSGYSGFSGDSGVSGFSGTLSGTSGTSGFSGALPDSVDDNLITLSEITPNSEVSDKIDFTVIALDAAGNPVTKQVALVYWESTTEFGPTSGDLDPTAGANLIVPHSASNVGLVLTNAFGVISLGMTDLSGTLSGDRYVMFAVPNDVKAAKGTWATP